MSRLLPFFLLLASCTSTPTVSLQEHVTAITKDRATADGYIAAQFDLMGLRRIDQVTQMHGARIRNIMAMVGRGQGHIILGAHHDAVPGSPGADDNASGIAVLLEVARRISRDPADVSVIFIAFGGEEMGTLGSLHYAKKPMHPLKDTIGMINLDMVGRIKEKLIVTGVDTAKEWDEALSNANTDGLSLVRKNGGVGPSDHTPFYLSKIPVLHLFSGAHEDYHKPTDTADKLNYQGMEQVADFVERLIRDVGARRRLTFQESEVKPPKKSSGGPRVTLGIIPDYTFEGKGVLLQGVRAGSPAAEADLKKGDVIVAFDGKVVANIEEYSALFFATKPDQKVVLTVERQGKRLQIKATVRGRGE